MNAPFSGRYVAMESVETVRDPTSVSVTRATNWPERGIPALVSQVILKSSINLHIQWNLTNPKCTGKEFLCWNGQGVGLHNRTICRKSKREWNTSMLVSIIKTPRLTIDRLDELFIKFWTLEGAVTERGAAITKCRLKPIDQSNRFNYGRSHYNMAFYCHWPIKSFTEISVSLAFASNFFVNNSSRRSSRCPRTISLDDRD